MILCGNSCSQNRTYITRPFRSYSSQRESTVFTTNQSGWLGLNGLILEAFGPTSGPAYWEAVAWYGNKWISPYQPKNERGNFLFPHSDWTTVPWKREPVWICWKKAELFFIELRIFFSLFAGVVNQGWGTCSMFKAFNLTCLHIKSAGMVYITLWYVHIPL